MPNYNGPGKYDPECERAFDDTQALCVALIVIGGDRGHGFAVKGIEAAIMDLPEMLDQMAQAIRAQRGDA